MFRIQSLIQGFETELIVHEPQPWNSNLFQIKFDNWDNKPFVIRLDRGRWEFVPAESDNDLNLEQLEINSIGYKIAELLTCRLKQQLEDFELSLG